MASVRFSSHTNSTLFTTCCGVAILDRQTHCPLCGEEVPYDAKERWNAAMNAMYGAANVRRMRAESDRKWREAESRKRARLDS